MKKLSIIASSFWGGGAERVAVNLANYFASTGHEVDLVVFEHAGPLLTEVHDGVNIVDLKVKPKRMWPYRPSTWLVLAGYFKRVRPEYVLSTIGHVNIVVGMSSYVLRPRRLVFREASTLDSLRKRNFVSRAIYETLLRRSYSRADRIIANSHGTKKDLVLHRIVPAPKIAVLPNPVLPLNYQERVSAVVEEPWLADSSLSVVLGVGRLHFLKNYPFLIESFAHIYAQNKNARLLILGDGEELSKLSTLIHEKGLADVAKIIGFQQNVYPYFAKARVFALSSLWEGFGNVIVEALSTGTPVVCVDCPGGPSMILEGGKYGRLVEPGDVKGFSDAILEALDSQPVDRDLLIKRAGDFSVSTIGKQYLAELTGRI